MSVLAFMLADSSELIYIVAVLIMIGVGWIGERLKAKTEQRGNTPPRPSTRRHPTALPRPQIPPLAEDAERSTRDRPHAPPAVPRTRPPVPPGPLAQRPQGRPAVPARPAGRQTPPSPRTIEERRAVIRGEATRQPTRAAPPPPPAGAPQVPSEKESWARLAKFTDETLIRPTESIPLQRTPTLPSAPVTSVAERGHITGESLRHLSVAELQMAFVLKEILEPPLALRDE